MDTKIPLACDSPNLGPVLLADTGPGQNFKRAVRGGKREKITRHAEGDEGSQTISAAQACKGSAKDKGRNGRWKGPRYSNPSRRYARAAEGGNPPPGRSAEELGIGWLEDHCPTSPSHAHNLIGKTQVDCGTIFKCKYCSKVVWLPDGTDLAFTMSKLMKNFGNDAGYQMMLDLYPKAKRWISKLQDLHYIEQTVSPEQLPVVRASVMLDREEPEDVEITEEDLEL